MEVNHIDGNHTHRILTSLSMSAVALQRLNVISFEKCGVKADIKNISRFKTLTFLEITNLHIDASMLTAIYSGCVNLKVIKLNGKY